MRKTIARRLTESKQQVPHFYLTVDCEIDGLLELRKTLNDKADGAYKLSVNDLVIKVAAIALRRVPKANASWTDEGVKLYKSADISVAVAIEGGLITPVVRQADNKGLGDNFIGNEGTFRTGSGGEVGPGGVPGRYVQRFEPWNVWNKGFLRSHQSAASLHSGCGRRRAAPGRERRRFGGRDGDVVHAFC